MHSSKWDIYIYHDIKAQGTLEKKGREEYKSQRDRGWRRKGAVCTFWTQDAAVLIKSHIPYAQNQTNKIRQHPQQAASTGLSGLQEDQEGVREKGQEG